MWIHRYTNLTVSTTIMHIALYYYNPKKKWTFGMLAESPHFADKKICCNSAKILKAFLLD